MKANTCCQKYFQKKFQKYRGCVGMRICSTNNGCVSKASKSKIFLALVLVFVLFWSL